MTIKTKLVLPHNALKNSIKRTLKNKLIGKLWRGEIGENKIEWARVINLKYKRSLKETWQIFWRCVFKIKIGLWILKSYQEKLNIFHSTTTQLDF